MSHPNPTLPTILRCMACGTLVDCPAGGLGHAVATHVPGCRQRGRTVAFSRLEAELFADRTR
jgi:hypothetical protein